MSAEPFTAFAFAVELRLPGSDAPLCEAAFCECEGLELRREIIRAARRGRPGQRAAAPRGRVVRQRDPAPRDDVELRPLGLVGARAARPGRPRHLRHRRPRRPTSRRSACAFACTAACRPRSPGPPSTPPRNDIAIESLELACEGIDIVRPGDKPLAAAAKDPVAKAQLRELDASFEREINKARWVTVQINPHELRTSFSHELGPTTRLDLRLAFDVDVDAPGPRGRRAPDDVRRLTERVAYFATPRAVRGAAPTRPAVRLAWGTFQFDGHVEALEETLEAFSPDGRPLRATLALSLVRAQIAPYAFAAR